MYTWGTIFTPKALLVNQSITGQLECYWSAKALLAKQRMVVRMGCHITEGLGKGRRHHCRQLALLAIAGQ